MPVHNQIINSKQNETSMKPLYECSIAELKALMKEKKKTPEEITSYFGNRLKKYGARENLNLIASLNENALCDARELTGKNPDDYPLYGIPFAVKDNIDCAFLPTTGGSLAFADNRPEKDAPVVRMLKKAGAVCLGKLNMTELANFTSDGMPNGYSSRGGQVFCAYDRQSDPGGSSTGSAVAVSAGLVPFALGTDTSFSVVGCASRNGVYGYKPARRNIDASGVMPISDELDAVGIFTKTADDLFLVLPVLEKEYRKASNASLTVGINTFRKEDVSENQLALYQNVTKALAADGIGIASLSHPSEPKLKELMYRDFARSMERYLLGTSSKINSFSSLVAYYHANRDTMMRYGASQLEASLACAREPENEEKRKEILAFRDELKKELDFLLGPYDAVLMTYPVTSVHFVGYPSVSVPIAYGADGNPKNMILYSVSEDKLLGAVSRIARTVSFCPFPKGFEED